MSSTMPHIQLTCSKKRQANSGESISFQHSKYVTSGVSWSTITKITGSPKAFDSGVSVTKSMLNPSRGHDGVPKGIVIPCLA